MSLPIRHEEHYHHPNNDMNSNIWKNLPKDLVDIILKEYAFSFQDLENACLKNDDKTIKFICKNYKLNCNNGLIIASMNGYLNIAKLMIRNGATNKLKAFYVSSLFDRVNVKNYLKKFLD